jgi:formylglycine-generating enzyme required for sulfatase activity
MSIMWTTEERLRMGAHGKGSSVLRVLPGGYWGSVYKCFSRAACRNWLDPGEGSDIFGLRLVLPQFETLR